jgi:hypothetical protein
VVIGGLLSLALAMFRIGAWAFAPLGIALLIIGAVYTSKATEWRNTFKYRVMTRLVKLFHPSLNYYPHRAIAEQGVPPKYAVSINSPDPRPLPRRGTISRASSTRPTIRLSETAHRVSPGDLR